MVAFELGEMDSNIYETDTQPAVSTGEPLRISTVIANQLEDTKILENICEKPHVRHPLCRLIQLPHPATSTIQTSTTLKYSGIQTLPRWTFVSGTDSSALSSPISRFREIKPIRNHLSQTELKADFLSKS